jgi:hypothetical protein
MGIAKIITPGRIVINCKSAFLALQASPLAHYALSIAVQYRTSKEGMSFLTVSTMVKQLATNLYKISRAIAP